MADIKITALNEILYAGLAADDVLAVDDIDASETKKITTATIKQYATENRGIGTNVAGAFVLTDSTQTLTGKTLTSPKINEDVAVTATASEINKLAGCTSSTAELNKLTGVTTTATQLQTHQQRQAQRKVLRLVQLFQYLPLFPLCSCFENYLVTRLRNNVCASLS